MIQGISDLVTRARPHPSQAAVVRLLLSLAIATVLWSWVSTVEDPETTVPFANVPIQVPELSGDRDVVTEPQQATVRVTAARSVVEDISRSEVVASLDLSSVDQAGSYTVPVEVSLNHDVRRIRVEPREVPIIVQETVSEIKPIQFVPPDLQDGTREIGQLQPQVTEVTITGSTTVMNTIDHVVVPIDIGDQTSTFTGNFEALAVTKDGVQVNDVTIQPSTLSVRIPISTRGKSVPVLVSVAGQPAAGFEEVYRAANPPMVLIDGPAEALAQVPFATTAAIDIDGQTGSVQRTVPIIGLPQGVTVLDPRSAEVSAVVQISPRGRRIVLTDQPVTVVGLSPNLTASMTPASVDVELLTEEGAGPANTPDSVTAIVDAAGLSRGVHQVQPQVILPPNTEWLSIEPEEITVKIGDANDAEAARAASTPAQVELPPPPT